MRIDIQLQFQQKEDYPLDMCDNIQLMESTPIICDPGTGYMKMGFAGDNFPKATFASLVGRPMLRCEQSLGEDVQLKEIMIGDDASKYRSLLELTYPTSEGIVQHWEDMQLLLAYSFDSIGVKKVQGTSVFMTEAIMNPTANKEGMLELMFEQFNIGRLQYGMQALMSLYAQAIETALLIDSGDGVTHCIPVVFGNLITSSFERLQIAGRHVTSHLLKLLAQRGYAFNSTSDFQIVRELKEKFCFVSGDIKIDTKMALETCIHEKQFVLPDGEKIKLGRERFLAPEILMNPSIAGLESEGCGQMVFKSINSCEMSLRRELYKNILISGGTSMLPGFPTRIKQEVQSRFRERVLRGASTNTSSVKIRVIDPPTRKYNVFIGASIIAKATQKVAEAWITKERYQQQGKHRMHKNKVFSKK